MRIVGAVGVVGDAAAFVGADLILVDDPFERGAIAQPILKGFQPRSRGFPAGFLDRPFHGRVEYPNLWQPVSTGFPL